MLISRKQPGSSSGDEDTPVGEIDVTPEHVAKLVGARTGKDQGGDNRAAIRAAPVRLHEDQTPPPLPGDGSRHDRPLRFAGRQRSGCSRGAQSPERAGARGNLTLRFGKLIDRDTTPLDGSFVYCDRPRDLQKGRTSRFRRRASDRRLGHQHSAHLASRNGAGPKQGGWYVSMNSDLGGAERKDFLVVAHCERK